MIIDQIHLFLAELNPNFHSVFLQVGNYSHGYQGNEEETSWVAVIIGVSVATFVIGGFFYTIFKGLLLDTIINGTPFSARFKFTPKNLRLAYKVVGCHVVVRDAGERREQYIFLISYLKRRFPNTEPMQLSDIPNMHEIYPETQEVFTWLNKHLDEEHKLQFIDFMVDLAFHNEKLSKREMNLIYFAGRVFGIPHNEVKSILTMRYKFYQDKRKREQEHRRKTRATRRPSVNLKKQALQILGLSPSVTDFDEVKKAYRNIAKKHHPDRFYNDSEQEKEKAHERFTAINTAYEYLEQVLK
jgi:DnaJ-domain-containing protein 1